MRQAGGLQDDPSAEPSRYNRLMSRLCILGFSLIAATAVPAQTVSPAPDGLRDEFRLAWQLARSNSSDAGDSDALRAYVLYPYLEAARISGELERSNAGTTHADAAAGAFLAEYGDEPVSRNLRIAWLESLAGREQWPLFQEHYREELADTALRCLLLQSQIALGSIRVEDALDAWLTPAQLPTECEPVFQWLRDTGELDDDMTAARVRLLLANGQTAFGRVIARRLPDEQARPLLAWATLIEQPRTAVSSQLAMASLEVDQTMLLDGWTRLARNEPAAALSLFPDLTHSLATVPLSIDPYTRALALGLAWDRRSEAVPYFTQAAGAGLDDYTLGWQARAALWNDDWGMLRNALAAMSAGERASAQWRYWSARASDDRDQRDVLYESILPFDNYFSALAAERLNDRPDIHPIVHEREDERVAELAAWPAVVRADELWQVRLPVAATREWRYATDSMNDDERRQSVHLAMDRGWYDLGVAAATGLGIFYDYALLYPQPYDREVEAAAAEFDLEPALIYAVIRQESLFRADAESSAGALGLMQLMPGTAADVARRLGEPAPARAAMLRPELNVRFGTAELRRLLERYDGNLPVALAAYNAGPAAADRWLPQQSIAGDIWLENVPYNETRDYVRRVLWHTVVFDRLAGRRADAEDWLRDVEPLR